MKEKILVIDDEESIRFTFENFLLDEGYEVVIARGFIEAFAAIDRLDFDLIFADILLEGKSGIDILREIRERKLNCPVVMITGKPNIETASEAVRLGAFDYIPKPVRQETLLRVTKMALQHKALSEEKEKYRSNLEAIFMGVKEAIIAVDKEMVVLEINEAAKSICNLSSDVVGKPFNLLTDSCSGKCLEILKETVKKKQPVEVSRYECRQKNFPLHIVTINTYPLINKSYKSARAPLAKNEQRKVSHNDKETFSGAILVVRDETRLANLEQDLKERQQFHNIIGKSEKIQAIYSLIEDLADVQTTVLVAGETGTGKELVIEALHYRGVRHEKPLVKVNCSALSENLLESELFGHVRGAFTGADRDKIGRFQKADGGTIFLDEIGDISQKVQLQLLRVLQEKEFERVGDSTPIKVDARVVAATNQDLQEKVKQGEFREDLYYRLKVVELRLPPLRDRREDIPLLVSHFLKKFNKKLNREIMSVSADVQEIFMNYYWPGNIRELEHTLEHAFIVCRQDTITVDHLPSAFKEFVRIKPSISEDMLNKESQAILYALEKSGWNKAGAARLLGISRRTIYRKIDEYKIKIRDL